MSRSNDEKKYPPKKSGAAARKGGIFPYKPSKADVEDMRSSNYSLDDAIQDLESRLKDSCGVTVGYNEDRDGFYAIARDTGAPFGENVSVSCWGGSISKCLLGLGYYLSVVNKDFPDGVQLMFPQLSDW